MNLKTKKLKYLKEYYSTGNQLSPGSRVKDDTIFIVLLSFLCFSPSNFSLISMYYWCDFKIQTV